MAILIMNPLSWFMIMMISKRQFIYNMSHVISKFIGPIMYVISQNVGEAMIPKHDNLALTTYTEQLI